MSYLAINAAPVNFDNNNNNNNNNNNKEMNSNKSKSKNKTVKNTNINRNGKIKAEMIRNAYIDDDADSNELADFNDNYFTNNFEQTEYSSIYENNDQEQSQQSQQSQQLQQLQESQQLHQLQQSQQYLSDSNISNNSIQNTDNHVTRDNFSELKSTYANDYYNKYLPYQGQNYSSNMNGNNELLKKLDSILYLLEEQQVEKTNYITEELILYIFLGVFIIYVLDSFVKVGKYVR